METYQVLLIYLSLSNISVRYDIACDSWYAPVNRILI